MYRTPVPLKTNEADLAFLCNVARLVLGSSTVAATNARRLAEAYQIDPKRVDSLIPWGNTAVEVDGFVFKKVEADPETPDNFGLFVRTKSAERPGLTHHT
jgi:hypothetical protein